MNKKRGFFISLENIHYDSTGSIEDYLSPHLRNQVKVVAIKDLPNDQEKLKQLKLIESMNEKMGKRAKHMLYAMERWKNREDIIKNLDKGISVIVLNYCFKEISEAISDDLDINWGKIHYTGLVRPDKVFYFDGQSSISKYFNNFRYMHKVKGITFKENIEEIVDTLKNINKDYSKSNVDDFAKNFYPLSIGEDLFMYPDI